MKFKITDLEKSLGIKIKRNTTSLGIDTASRTGWALIKTDDKDLVLDYSFVDIDSKDFCFKLSKLIEFFDEFIKRETNAWTVVIEDSFLKFNVRVLAFLSKMEGALFAVCKYKGINKVSFLFASTARRNLGIKGNCKKPEIKAWILEKMGLELSDEDACDAIVLAINGVKE